MGIAQRLSGMTPWELLEYDFRRVQCQEDVCYCPGGANATHLDNRIIPTRAELAQRDKHRQLLHRPLSLLLRP